MRAQDSLVSFGERLSTRLFAALLNHQVDSKVWRFHPAYPLPKHSAYYVCKHLMSCHLLQHLVMMAVVVQLR